MCIKRSNERVPGALTSLRKQPSFFAPGPSGVSTRAGFSEGNAMLRISGCLRTNPTRSATRPEDVIENYWRWICHYAVDKCYQHKARYPLDSDIAIYTVEIVNEQLGLDDLARLELPLDTLPNVTNCGHRSQDLSKC